MIIINIVTTSLATSKSHSGLLLASALKNLERKMLANEERERCNDADECNRNVIIILEGGKTNLRQTKDTSRKEDTRLCKTNQIKLSIVIIR